MNIYPVYLNCLIIGYGATYHEFRTFGFTRIEVIKRIMDYEAQQSVDREIERSERERELEISKEQNG